MSNLTLDHLTTDHRTRDHRTSDRLTTARPDTRRRARTAALPGSYVDTDGARRAPQRLGSYVGRTSSSAVGSYTDRDGVRAVTVPGSYTRVER